MTEFEYKLFPSPRQISGGAELQTDGASFAPTLEQQINLITSNGWEFVGREAMPVERRRWLILKRTVNEDFLVFRRPFGQEVRPPKLRWAKPQPDPGRIRPRRVVRNYFPDSHVPAISVRRALAAPPRA